MFHIVYIFIYIYYMYICVPCMIHSASWSHWCFETAAFLQALVPALQWLLGLCETFPVGNSGDSRHHRIH